MSGNALPFVCNFYVYLIVFANTFQIQIKYKYAPFCDFQYKYTKCWFTNTYLNPTLTDKQHSDYHQTMPCVYYPDMKSNTIVFESI